MLYSKDTLNKINNIFRCIMDNPNEITAELNSLKEVLETSITPNHTISTIKTSKPSSPFLSLAIPDKYIVPFNDIQSCKSYNVDIDLSLLVNHKVHGTTPEMYTAWLLHEIFHNILTTTTMTRFKMLLMSNVKPDMIRFYQTEIMKPVGTYIWLDIFSRTVKDIIKPHNIAWGADQELVNLDIHEDWNLALTLFLKNNGGNIQLLSMDQMEREDRSSLALTNHLIKEHNAIGREFVYSSDRKRKFNSLRKYVIKLMGSSLFASAFENDYKNLFNMAEDRASVISEKYINSKINDNLILKENASEFGVEGIDYQILSEGIIFNRDFNYPKYLKKIDEIRYEMEDVRDIDMKLDLMYRLRDIKVKLDKHLENNPKDEECSAMLEDVVDLLSKLSKITPTRNKKSWGVWIAQDAVPPGYEG